MTTLVALASKDALVMGTDSLATLTKPLVDPLDIIQYFDTEDDFRIRLDDKGMPFSIVFSLLWIKHKLYHITSWEMF